MPGPALLPFLLSSFPYCVSCSLLHLSRRWTGRPVAAGFTPSRLHSRRMRGRPAWRSSPRSDEEERGHVCRLTRHAVTPRRLDSARPESSVLRLDGVLPSAQTGIDHATRRNSRARRTLDVSSPRWHGGPPRWVCSCTDPRSVRSNAPCVCHSDPSVLPGSDFDDVNEWSGLEFARDDIVPMVRPFHLGVLIIMTVGTGVTIMLSGSFDFQKVLSFVLIAGFAWGIFEMYYSDTESQPCCPSRNASLRFPSSVSTGPSSATCLARRSPRSSMGAALLRRRLFRLFIGVFARGRSLFGSFCAGTAPRTAPTRLFRAASPA